VTLEDKMGMLALGVDYKKKSKAIPVTGHEGL
jgi:hypothetical protein